jgi:DtxR family Mn-dependent transcriptional regulator
MKEEIIIQDTLKHLAESEHDGRPVSRETLAAELALPPDVVQRILHDLEAAELLEADSLTMTPSGREYALHVLRAHRLYETYLAHRTGVRESEWHTRAHVAEHKLSAADVEQLNRDLNYPRFDPHGDAIPTASGLMAPKVGRPLTDHPVGWEGQVVHVEDEPPERYALIAAASIAPGTVLRIEASNQDQVRVAAEGCVFGFPPATAEQITVIPLSDGEHFDRSLERLSSLVEGEAADVVRLSPLCRGLDRSRLLDLGLVPGTTLSVDLVSPSGSPVAYRVRGASIALRREQAERVLIRKHRENADG